MYRSMHEARVIKYIPYIPTLEKILGRSIIKVSRQGERLKNLLHCPTTAGAAVAAAAAVTAATAAAGSGGSPHP